jgi:hypothetical protein
MSTPFAEVGLITNKKMAIVRSINEYRMLWDIPFFIAGPSASDEYYASYVDCPSYG